VLVFSGKRKSGKDHTTEILKSRYAAGQGAAPAGFVFDEASPTNHAYELLTVHLPQFGRQVRFAASVRALKAAICIGTCFASRSLNFSFSNAAAAMDVVDIVCAQYISARKCGPAPQARRKAQVRRKQSTT
jgi:hypothetical protein